MSDRKLPTFSKVAIVTIGVIIVALDLALLRFQAFSLGFISLLVFSVLVAARMSIVIPRSKVVISFSDSVVFLSFLLYGPASAVIMAGAETLANCYYNKLTRNIKFARGMIAVNTFGAIIGTAVACSFWVLYAADLQVAGFETDTRSLVGTLGVLALAQFVTSTIFPALIMPLKDGEKFWTA